MTEQIFANGHELVAESSPGCWFPHIKSVTRDADNPRMGQPQQQRYSAPTHPHQRYPQPPPQQPLPQQQVYLIPAAQPQPDVWRKRLLIINGIIACLVFFYFVSQSPQTGSSTQADAADGRSNLESGSAALSYPADLAVGEYREPIVGGQRWTVYTQTQDPSSHVELSEDHGVRIQDATQSNQFIAEKTTVNSQNAGQTLTPKPLKISGHDAYVWSYYDASRAAEIRNLWVLGSTMSHRLQCKILDAERARGLQLCEAATASLAVKTR